MITGTGNILFGNNQNGTLTPAGTTPLNDASYYLAAIPSFWNIPDTWPSIGISSLLNAKTIPAKAGYLAGKYTDMPPVEPVTDLQELKTTPVSLYSNPISEYLSLSYYSKGSGGAKITISDLMGKSLMGIDVENNMIGINTRKINISPLTKGIYLMSLSSDQGKSVLKMVVK